MDKISLAPGYRPSTAGEGALSADYKVKLKTNSETKKAIKAQKQADKEARKAAKSPRKEIPSDHTI